jgi:hypothetical protein
VFGIPIHAWCDDFFVQLTRPWGSYLNADDVTNKKLTMDAARLLIRTSYQKPVDEFIDVNINGELFHLRVLEDSYGPMRIMIPQSKGTDGRGNVSVCSEAEDEDEEERRLSEEEPESERESEGEGENLIALNPLVIANDEPLLIANHGDISNSVVEGSKEYSNEVTNVVNEDFLKVNGGGTVVLEGVSKKDRWVEFGGKDLGQEVGVGGPGLCTNSYQLVKGGGNRRETKSEDVGILNKPNLSYEVSSGGKGGLKGGVYSDGPRGVYDFLNKGQKLLSPTTNKNTTTQKKKTNLPVCPPSASLRRQQQLARSFSIRKSNPSQAEPIPSKPTSSIPSVGDKAHSPSTEVIVSRGPIRQKFNSTVSRAGSISSAGEILCCSSLNSTDIRNCNSVFLKKFEQEVVSKVWKGAVDLGVDIPSVGYKGGAEGAFGGLEEVCRKEIQDNEKRDEEERTRREHHKSCHK